MSIPTDIETLSIILQNLNLETTNPKCMDIILQQWTSHSNENDIHTDDAIRKELLRHKDSIYDVLSQRLFRYPKETEEEMERCKRIASMFIQEVSTLNNNNKEESGEAREEEEYKLMNVDRVGLISKECFKAMECIVSSPEEGDEYKEAYLLRLFQLLHSFVQVYPTSVLSASCAGGNAGIQRSIGSMLSLSSLSSTNFIVLWILTFLIKFACGVSDDPAAAAAASRGSATANKSSKRKFIKHLADWGFLKLWVRNLTSGCDSTGNEMNGEHRLEDSVHAEELCDSLLDILESITYPPSPTPEQQNNPTPPPSEDIIDAATLEIIIKSLKPSLQMLIQSATDSASIRSTASARTLLGIYELAIGCKHKDDENPEQETPEQQPWKLPDEQKNKWIASGVTNQIHWFLVEDCIPPLIQGIHFTMERHDTRKSSSGGRDLYSFTSKRLFLMTLLADMLEYENKQQRQQPQILDIILKLPLPPKGGDAIDQAVVPWPNLIEMLFSEHYTSSTLFHIQFYRIFTCVLQSNHEPTLLLFLQKSKFVTRAIASLKNKNKKEEEINKKKKGDNTKISGILNQCLNALRLQYQCLVDAKKASFVRSYLDSHDGWKDYQNSLIGETMDQQRPGLGLVVPSKSLTPSAISPSSSSISDSDTAMIDIGSTYALDLGYDKSIIERYSLDAEEEDHAEDAATGGTKKRKKKKKKKNKKKKDGTSSEDPSGMEEDGDHDE